MLKYLFFMSFFILSTEQSQAVLRYRLMVDNCQCTARVQEKVGGGLVSDFIVYHQIDLFIPQLFLSLDETTYFAWQIQSEKVECHQRRLGSASGGVASDLGQCKSILGFHEHFLENKKDKKNHTCEVKTLFGTKITDRSSIGQDDCKSRTNPSCLEDGYYTWEKNGCVRFALDKKSEAVTVDLNYCRCAVGSYFAMIGDICTEFTLDGRSLGERIKEFCELSQKKDQSICPICPGPHRTELPDLP